MGYKGYSDSDLLSRKRAIASSGVDTFAFTERLRNARSLSEIKCHQKLDPSRRKMWECRDSKTHPESNALALLFDVTGSMGRVPKELETYLKDLMGYFLKNDYLPSAAVLFGAVGDSTCDRVPLQFGEFEPGAQELMDFFQRVYLEGGGGSSNTESYQNILYFMARHTVIDCYEKRKKKGYIYMFGDELPYNQVSAREIKALTSNGTGQDVPTKQIIREVKEKYNLFYVIPLNTSGGRDPEIWSTWRSMLGEEYVLGMEKTSQVCDLVGTVTGVCEGKITAQAAIAQLKEKGVGSVEENYLEILKKSFTKLYGINASKGVASKPPKPAEKAGKGPEPKKTSKSTLKI